MYRSGWLCETGYRGLRLMSSLCCSVNLNCNCDYCILEKLGCRSTGLRDGNRIMTYLQGGFRDINTSYCVIHQNTAHPHCMNTCLLDSWRKRKYISGGHLAGRITNTLQLFHFQEGGKIQRVQTNRRLRKQVKLLSFSRQSFEGLDQITRETGRERERERQLILEDV